MNQQRYPAEAAAPGTSRFLNMVGPTLHKQGAATPQPPRKGDSLLSYISAASSKVTQKRGHGAAAARRPAVAAAAVRVSEEEVLSVLECPVCFEYMEAPIYMCGNGHNVCAQCLPRLRGACPSCRGALSVGAAARNLALERLAASAAGGPCRNAFAGCPQRRLRAAQRAAHEAACPFEPLPCPLRCGWRGADQLRAHLTAAHARHTTRVPELDSAGRALSAVQLAISQAGCFRSHDHAFLAFGHVFSYAKRFSVEDRRLYLAVHFFGAAEEARHFRYELALQRGQGGDEYDGTTYARTVHHWSKELSDLIYMKKCILVEFDTLVYYGKGTRTLKIHRVADYNHPSDHGVYCMELESKNMVETKS